MKESMTATALEVPLLDLGAQTRPIHDEVIAAIARVVGSQKFILGEEVRRFEERIAAYCNVPHSVGCASGSDALLLALKALDIGPGDEVLTVPFTFFSTAGAISLVGARPVFVDVEPETFNMDMSQVEQAIAAHTKLKAILPVHLFGGCADMDTLNQIAARRNLAVIEDAAQSIGGEYKGKRAGGLGTIGCFSFYPTKNLGAFGDGGLCTTSDDALAEKLRALRVHGRTNTYYHQWVGVASRLDAIQAAILGVKLNYLDGWSAGRARNADLYRRLIAEQNVPVIPPMPSGYQTRHIYNQFVIRCPRDRDGLQAYLKSHHVGCEIYYPLALHQQPCFADLGYQAGAFPVSEHLAQSTLALPIYTELAPEQIEYVVSLIGAFYQGES
jgi:dTDP-4-amino-4,6-dideoxygalactose transaminase